MKICIYGASSIAIDKSFIDAGELLGKTIAQNNHSVVFGGGAAGLMGAVARGAQSNMVKLLVSAHHFLTLTAYCLKTAPK